MSDSWRSDNPNAPKISHSVYIEEKLYFAGNIIGSVLYGTLAVLFFRCIAALFNPGRRKMYGINWGLVSYTVAMFSLATVFTTMNLTIGSVAYIDNREYPGVEDKAPPGPAGFYDYVIYKKPINLVSNVALISSGWLADGLLLHRCYLIYSANLCIIILPCIVYVGSVAMGIFAMCLPGGVHVWFEALPFYSISLSLNIILTFMIAIRIFLLARKVCPVLGSQAKISGLHRVIIAMLVESCALYAAASLLVIVPLAAGSMTAVLFIPILSEIQIIAPLLIVQRVANRNLPTSDAGVVGNTSSFCVGLDTVIDLPQGVA